MPLQPVTLDLALAPTDLTLAFASNAVTVALLSLAVLTSLTESQFSFANQWQIDSTNQNKTQTYQKCIFN